MDISAACGSQPVFITLSVCQIRRKGGDKMTSVMLRQNESQDQLLKRFRKKVVKSGVLSTVRRKRWFVSKSELRRIEKKKAIRRFKRRQNGKVYEPTV